MCFSFHTCAAIADFPISPFFRDIKNGEIEKLAVAAHVWKEKHAMDHKLVLLKQGANKQELTNWENIL